MKASQDRLNGGQWNAVPFVFIVLRLEENDILQQS